MTSSVPAPQPAIPALDPRVTLRAVTVAGGAVGGLWRLVNVAGIPVADAAPAFLAGLLLGLAQLAWTARLVARPSRRWLLLGAAVTGLSLIASLAVLTSVPVGRAGAVPAVVGIALQLTFLGLTLLGATRAAPSLVLRQAARVGLVTVALAMSVLVAGGAQDHAHAAGSDRDSGGGGRTAVPRSLLCHLI